MSRTAVGLVIDRLLDDDRFRRRFMRARLDTLLHLSVLGIHLTVDEIEVFVHSDARAWSRRGVAGDRMH